MLEVQNALKVVLGKRGLITQSERRNGEGRELYFILSTFDILVADKQHASMRTATSVTGMLNVRSQKPVARSEVQKV